MGPEIDLKLRCQREGTPLIETGKAVFIWYGEDAPRLIGDFNEWAEDQAVELQPFEDEKAWFYEMDLPDDAYIEYAYIGEDQTRYLDPLNPRRISNGMGKTNQYFYMKQAKPTPWIIRQYGKLEGEVSQSVIDAPGLLAGGKRTVHYYQPPVDDPCPLVVVWDGGDYLRRAKLVTMIENLISAGRIRPVALAMLENGGPARRMEYACSETTIGFLLSTLLPQAFLRLNLVDPDDAPGAFGVLGASMGGLMALYTGLRLPRIFGHVLAQSGAYEVDGFDFVTSFMVEHGPRLPIKVWMDVGKFEGLLEANRRMHARLVERGYDVAYQEYHAGHNYPAWRNDLPSGLEFSFGMAKKKSGGETGES